MSPTQTCVLQSDAEFSFRFAQDGRVRTGKTSLPMVASVIVHAVSIAWFALGGPFQTVVAPRPVTLEPITVSFLVLPAEQPVAKTVEVPKPVPAPAPPEPSVAEAVRPIARSPATALAPRPQTTTAQAVQPAAQQAKPVTAQPKSEQGVQGVRPNSGNPTPSYPGMSRRRGEEGQVVLQVVVGTDGRVASLSVAQSSGFRRLDKAALDAVRQWRFQPARRGSTPVRSVARIPIRFALR